MAGKRIDEAEKEKRIHQISLMLRKKSVSFIMEYIKLTWGIKRSQAFRYIKSARKEWEKYFKNLKRSGMDYHLRRLRKEDRGGKKEKREEKLGSRGGDIIGRKKK